MTTAKKCFYSWSTMTTKERLPQLSQAKHNEAKINLKLHFNFVNYFRRKFRKCPRLKSRKNSCIVIKFRYCDKATKFEQILHLFLTLLSKFKTKWKIFWICEAFPYYLSFILITLKMQLYKHFRHTLPDQTCRCLAYWVMVRRVRSQKQIAPMSCTDSRPTKNDSYKLNF